METELNFALRNPKEDLCCESSKMCRSWRRMRRREKIAQRQAGWNSWDCFAYLVLGTALLIHSRKPIYYRSTHNILYGQLRTVMRRNNWFPARTGICGIYKFCQKPTIGSQQPNHTTLCQWVWVRVWAMAWDRRASYLPWNRPQSPMTMQLDSVGLKENKSK